MADGRAESADRVVVDANYVRNQALLAIGVFVAPLHGLVRAVNGQSQGRAAHGSAETRIATPGS